MRAWTADSLRGVSLANNRLVADKLIASLNDPEWLVRFMALHTLQPIADIDSYLQWATNTESNAIIRRQSQLLMKQEWEAPYTTKPAEETGAEIETK